MIAMNDRSMKRIINGCNERIEVVKVQKAKPSFTDVVEPSGRALVVQPCLNALLSSLSGSRFFCLRDSRVAEDWAPSSELGGLSTLWDKP